MIHRLTDPLSNPRRLSQSVLQISDMLAMYRAELARVLRLQCRDIGELANGRWLLEPDTAAWVQARHLVDFYQLLYDRLEGDGVAMRHWLRREHPAFQRPPLLMMVDDGRLTELLSYLRSHDEIFHDLDNRFYSGKLTTCRLHP